MSSDDRIGDELAHARLGPSGADGWMVCAGKPNAEDGLPDDPTEFAAEGTAAHAVADACLSDPLGYEPFDFVGQVFHIDGFVIDFDEDMAEALVPGIEWTRAQSGQFYGEHRVDLSHWLGPGQFGTLDRGIIAPDLITIADLKFGRGMPVSPVRNRQMMLYALGFWREHCQQTHSDPATRFRLMIDQPRHAGGGGEWFITLGELLEFGEEARTAAQVTLNPDARRKASEKGCTWCKRRKAPGGCSTYDEYNLDLLGVKFEDLDCPDAQLDLPTLTPERRSVLLRHSKMIEGWLENLHEETLADALAGRETPTLKAVEGRKSPDKWRDKEAAQAAVTEILGDERSFTKKLITPTQTSKLVSAEDFEAKIEPQITRGSKKPILVPDADAREAIVSYEAKFDEEPEEG